MASIEERLKDVPSRLIILAACGFARMVEHLLTDERSRVALEVVERFVDGLATAEELVAPAQAAVIAAAHTAEGAAEQKAAWTAAWAAEAAMATERAEVRAALAAEAPAEKAAWAQSWAANAAKRAAEAVGEAAEREVKGSESEAEAANHSILDCILPARIQSSFPSHVKGLATTIYDKRDWSLMPILADALEEIGQTEMAAHCRQPIHAKGCHVLDSILGR